MSETPTDLPIVIRCPVCRAQVVNGPQCRRCRADLALLFGLEEQRTRALRAAREAAAQGLWSEARRRASRAENLRHGEDAARLVAAALLLERDFAGAWQLYQRSVRTSAVARASEPGDNG